MKRIVMSSFSFLFLIVAVLAVCLFDTQKIAGGGSGKSEAVAEVDEFSSVWNLVSGAPSDTESVTMSFVEKISLVEKYEEKTDNSVKKYKTILDFSIYNEGTFYLTKEICYFSCYINIQSSGIAGNNRRDRLQFLQYNGEKTAYVKKTFSNDDILTNDWKKDEIEIISTYDFSFFNVLRKLTDQNFIIGDKTAIMNELDFSKFIKEIYVLSGLSQIENSNFSNATGNLKLLFADQKAPKLLLNAKLDGEYTVNGDNEEIDEDAKSSDGFLKYFNVDYTLEYIFKNINNTVINVPSQIKIIRGTNK